jgi:hypothetical protein
MKFIPLVWLIKILTAIRTQLAGKQNTLVGSGTGQNIKTVGSQNILGTGDIPIGTPAFVTPVTRTLNRGGLVSTVNLSYQQLADKLADLSNFVSGTNVGDISVSENWTSNPAITAPETAGIVTRNEDSTFGGAFGQSNESGAIVSKSVWLSSIDINRDLHNDIRFFATSTSAATLAAKVVNTAPHHASRRWIWRFNTWEDFGVAVAVKFTITNSIAAPTMNIAGLNAPMHTQDGTRITNANWAAIIGTTNFNIFRYNRNLNQYVHFGQINVPFRNGALFGISFGAANTAVNPTLNINNTNPLPMHRENGERMTGNVFPVNTNMVFRYDAATSRLTHLRNEPISRIKDGAGLAFINRHNQILTNPTLRIPRTEQIHEIFNIDGSRLTSMLPLVHYNLRFSRLLNRWIVQSITSGDDLQKWNRIFSDSYGIFGSTSISYRYINNFRSLEIVLNWPMFWGDASNIVEDTYFGTIRGFEIYNKRNSENIVIDGLNGRLGLDHSGNITLGNKSPGQPTFPDLGKSFIISLN